MTEEIIMHFGVKGMKWGVRKSQDSIPKKSAHRIRTEASFIAKGCSPSEAEIRADKVIRTQKKMAIAAGVAIASIAATSLAIKIGKEYTGVHVAEGTTLQHISKADSLDLTGKHLYTTFKKADKFNYQGTFATELGGLTGTQTHAIALKAKKAIKAPSNIQAKKIMSEAMGKKVNSKEYRKFINGFFKADENNNPTMKKFKENLIAKGYNAVIDTTDQNAYAKAFKPTIVFNSSQNLGVAGSTALSKERISKNFLTVKLSQALVPKAETLAKGAVFTSALGGVHLAGLRNDASRISSWRQEHSSSNLTDGEILGKIYTGHD